VQDRAVRVRAGQQTACGKESMVVQGSECGERSRVGELKTLPAANPDEGRHSLRIGDPRTQLVRGRIGIAAPDRAGHISLPFCSEGVVVLMRIELELRRVPAPQNTSP